jgi:hypothetical protein
MSIAPITASNIVNNAINDLAKHNHSVRNNASSGDIANDSDLSQIDDQWLRHQADIMGSLLKLDKSPTASTEFEAAVLQHKNFVNDFSTIAGTLAKSTNRLSQING